jgi:hypothetical protein
MPSSTNPRPRKAAKPAPWLTGLQVSRLPYGTALTYEDPSHRGPRIRGRLTAVIAGDLTVATATGEEHTVAITAIHRARVIASLLDDGDPVVRRGIPAGKWRGGVVRTGTNPATGRPGVYVETLEGFAWWDESELELVVDEEPPPARRGRPRAAADADLAEQYAGRSR